MFELKNTLRLWPINFQLQCVFVVEQLHLQNDAELYLCNVSCNILVQTQGLARPSEINWINGCVCESQKEC